MKELKLNGIDYRNDYKCPICHSIHEMNDCDVEEWFVKSKHTGSTVSGRHAVHKFVDSYLYVRLCHKCYKRLHATRTILKVLFMGLFPIAMTVWLCIRNPKDASFGGIILMLGVYLFVVYILGGIINRILEKTVFDFDYKQADKDGALLSPYEVMNYKKEKQKSNQ